MFKKNTKLSQNCTRKSETSKKNSKKKSCHHSVKIRPKKETLVPIAKSQSQREKLSDYNICFQ